MNQPPDFSNRQHMSQLSPLRIWRVRSTNTFPKSSYAMRPMHTALPMCGAHNRDRYVLGRLSRTHPKQGKTSDCVVCLVCAGADTAASRETMLAKASLSTHHSRYPRMDDEGGWDTNCEASDDARLDELPPFRGKTRLSCPPRRCLI